MLELEEQVKNLEISNQLVKPLLARIVHDYGSLYEDLKNHGSEEASLLRSEIRARVAQIEGLDVYKAMEMVTFNEVQNEKLRDILRNLKLELRFMRRKWQRHKISENRVRRNKEKRAYVSTFAA